jgi:transcription initiation factor TFIID TATA-box-binding protein
MSKIQNIVSTAYLAQNINLKTIIYNIANIEYNKTRFTAAILRIRNPRTTTLIFPSGQLVCTGAKNISDSKKALRRVARSIQKIYIKNYPKVKIYFKNFKTVNIVGSFNTDYKIDLISLNRATPKNSWYLPEVFPGLKYLPSLNEKVLSIIFISGKVIITGSKDLETLETKTTQIKRLLLKFKRPYPYIVY